MEDQDIEAAVAAPEACVACGCDPGVVVVHVSGRDDAPICARCWTSGWKARTLRRSPRREARLQRRRELFQEQLVMVQLLRQQVDDEGQLAPESSDFVRGLLMNIRLQVGMEPSGDEVTDALHERVVREVTALLQEIHARTRPSRT